jgi:hypothetical protein
MILGQPQQRATHVEHLEKLYTRAAERTNVWRDCAIAAARTYAVREQFTPDNIADAALGKCLDQQNRAGEALDSIATVLQQPGSSASASLRDGIRDVRARAIAEVLDVRSRR